jgi:metal-responsive CopG/Arc/MetJ family transcriptional regulator
VVGRPKKIRDDIQKCHIVMPKILHRELKHISFDKGKTMSEIITELVRKYVKKERNNE